MLEFLLGTGHDLLEALLSSRFFLRRKDETHAAAGHAAEHPESPEGAAELRGDALNNCFREKIGRPGNNRLDWLAEVACGGSADCGNIPVFERLKDFIEDAQHALPSFPFSLGAEKVFLGDHFQDGANVLGHATVHED